MSVVLALVLIYGFIRCYFKVAALLTLDTPPLFSFVLFRSVLLSSLHGTPAANKPGPHHPHGDGRLRGRGQDGGQPPPGQEHDWSFLPAAGGAGRHEHPQEPPRQGVGTQKRGRGGGSRAD